MNKNIFNKYTERHVVKPVKKITDDNKVEVKIEDILFDDTSEVSYKIYHTRYSVNGPIGYMCSNCYTVEHITTNINTDFNLIFNDRTDDEIEDMESESNRLTISTDHIVKGFCPVCGYYGKYIKLDENIADAIAILNIKGYLTGRSSEGRKIGSTIIDPYITFSTMEMRHSTKMISDMERYMEDTLPLSWYVYRRSDCMSYTYTTHNTLKPFDMKNYIPVYMFGNFVIMSDYWNKEEALDDILKWARSLPDLTQKEG